MKPILAEMTRPLSAEEHHVLSPEQPDQLRTIFPVPNDAPKTPKLSKESGRWAYRDPEGRLLSYMVRVPKTGGGKEYFPQCFCEGPDGSRRWQLKAVPEPRPLYGLDRLAARPGATVLVVEGEKKCEPAESLFPEVVAIASPGGSGAAGKADWSPLCDRRVVIWRDNDEPGEAYQNEVGNLALAAGAASISTVPVPDTFPAKWDLADPIPAEFTADDLRQLLASAAPYTSGCREASTVVAASTADGGKGPSQRDKLLAVIDDATLWHDKDGEAYATVPVGNHFEHHHIQSRGFRDWLIRAYAERFPLVVNNRQRPGSVGKNAILEALLMAEAQARDGGAPEHHASMRSIMHGGSIYIDLGDPDWRCIEVSTGRRRIISTAPVPILRSRKAHALPEPADRGSITPLFDLFPSIELEDRKLLVAWLLAALWPTGPYPILIINAEQGAGKTTLTRLLRRLTDPAGGDVLQPPRDERDLVAQARNNRVLPFDNLSGLTAELADALCRLATGAEIGGRALYTDHDAATFAASRPLILNGIPNLATRGDLASRSFVICLPRLESVRTEEEILGAFDAHARRIIASLMDGLDTALRNLPATTTPQAIRMADAARIAAAAAPAFGWQPSEMISAIRESAQRLQGSLVDCDTVAIVVMRLVESSGEFHGSPTELHNALLESIRDHERRDFPSNARWLSDRLRRAAPALRHHGIDVHQSSKKLNGVYPITIAPVPHETAQTDYSSPRSSSSGGSAAQLTAGGNEGIWGSKGSDFASVQQTATGHQAVARDDLPCTFPPDPGHQGEKWIFDL